MSASAPSSETATSDEVPENSGITESPATIQASGESTATQNPSPERPAWLPQQFKTPEELSAAYTELENRIVNNPEAPISSEDLKVSDANAQKVTADLESKGFSLEALTEEYFKNGGFSEARYKELIEASGQNRASIDTHIAGCEALRERTHQEVTAVIGGPEVFATLAEWAGQSLSAEALKSYNKLANSNDVHAMKLAVQGLYTQYTKANGKDPKMVQGQAARPGSLTDMAQITSAMADPRYKTDPTYRRQVEEQVKLGLA